MTYPNGLQSSFTYDDLNRVTAMNAAKASYSYTLSPTGNRTGAVESSGRVVNWSYDGIYRLTNEAISLDPHSVNGSVGYGLDPVGNRQSQTSTLPGIGTGSFTHDPDDRLNTETYDANGNTLTSGGKTFAYDFENRLKSMTEGTVAVTLAYDADGNRVAKTVGGVTTRYLVDDLNPTGYAQVVEEVTAGAVTRQYTYGLQRISQTQQIANAWTPAFYGYDGAGTVRLLTDSTGTVTDTYDYDAWGNTVNQTGSTPNVYRYRGEQYDPDLGIYYLRARYFGPSTGRFLSRDLYRGSAKDPLSLHKYLYASANPIGNYDSTGYANNITYALLYSRLVAVASPVITTVGLMARGQISLGINSFITSALVQDMIAVGETEAGFKPDPIAARMRVSAAGTFLNMTTGRIISAVAVSGNNWKSFIADAVEDAGIVVVKLKNPLDYLPPGVTDKPLDAEAILVAWGQKMGYGVLSIAPAGQPICPSCWGLLEEMSARQFAMYGFPIFY